MYVHCSAREVTQHTETRRNVAVNQQNAICILLMAVVVVQHISVRVGHSF